MSVTARAYYHSTFDDFIAVADAHQGIGFVGVTHIFHRIGDDFSGRQGVEHSVMSHSDSVTDGSADIRIPNINT